MTSLLVCYIHSRSYHDRPFNTIVDVPNDIEPNDIPDFVKETIRPSIKETIYGEKPAKITLLNLVNLSRLQ